MGLRSLITYSLLVIELTNSHKPALAGYKGEHTPFDAVDDGFGNGLSGNLLAAFDKDHPEFIEHLMEADEDEYKHEYLNYY